MAEIATIARPYAEAAFRLAQQRQALPVWSEALARLAPARSQRSGDWSGRSLSLSARHEPVPRSSPQLGRNRGEAAWQRRTREVDESFRLGTTSVEAADEEAGSCRSRPAAAGCPQVIAGKTGIGLSQRGQSFDTDPAQNPYNVIEPGKRPHVTLTPTLALKDGAPFLAFAVQGGDEQDQNLLQFFLNVVEFGMTPQEATEAANFNTFQVRKWLGDRQSVPGRILLNEQTPAWVRSELRRMGYDLTFEDRTSGPINAIWLDRAHGTMWGGSSNHGEDYGIAW
jgi:gamma-glutamyltranspeptidase/glutathione hydrolase